MAGEPILIIDDNEMNTELLVFVLSSHGYEVRSAPAALAALDLMKTFQPRLILMDIQLPDIDGLELTRRLKASPATRDIIIIAVTAYAMKGDREQATAAGCDGYLPKPIDTRALPVAVAEFLRGKTA